MRLQFWAAKLEICVRDYGFDKGYKFLFVPWETLNKRDTVFLSHMPNHSISVPADHVDLRRISSEGAFGDQFAIDIVNSPVIQQFNKLAHLIGKLPINILAGATTPFRTNDWNGFCKKQQEQAIELGKRFWKEAFNLAPIELIITSGETAKNMVLDQFEPVIMLEMLSGWENLKLIRYETSEATSIVCLPDLAEYELLSKDECIDPLRQIFRNNLI